MNNSDAQMVHMRLPAKLLKRVDDFRFKNRFESRTETVRWLLEWALKLKPKQLQRQQNAAAARAAKKQTATEKNAAQRKKGA